MEEVDSHVYAGYPFLLFDCISKTDSNCRTREEAINTVHALSNYNIESVKTIPFHQQLMRDEKFRSNDFNTKSWNFCIESNDKYLQKASRYNGSLLIIKTLFQKKKNIHV